MTIQIFWGSLVLGICSSINILMMILYAKLLKRFDRGSQKVRSIINLIAIIAFTFAVILIAHTIQIWIWAYCLIAVGALDDYSDAVYFSIVTYTTVGYGDLTLTPDFRIFGAMASVTGLLGFGISTAFLVENLTRIFANHRD